MYASSSLSSSLHKIVLKIERSQITVTAAQLFWNVSGYHINARAFPILQYEGGLDKQQQQQMKYDHCTQTSHLLLPNLFFLKFKTQKTWKKCIIIARMVTPSPPPKRSACGIKAAVPHVQEWKIGTHKVKGFFTPKIKQKSNNKKKKG